MFFKILDTNHLIEEFMLTANKIVSKEVGFIKKETNKKHLFIEYMINLMKIKLTHYMI